MRHRVAVTGMGVISPIGCSVPELTTALRQGRSGAGPITLFDPAKLRTRIAAEVKPAFAVSRDRKSDFALRAAQEAMLEAMACGTVPGMADRGREAAICLGMGLELFSLDDLALVRRPGYEPPTARVDRATFLQTPSDGCLHSLSAKFGLGRPPTLHTSACASGTDAIGHAFHVVRSGRRRWMLAGATDSMINPMGVGGFCKISATSSSNDDPARASRPFDRRRDGFVLGEGAAVLVLERLDDALERGAAIRAEIVGSGAVQIVTAIQSGGASKTAHSGSGSGTRASAAPAGCGVPNASPSAAPRAAAASACRQRR